MKSLVAVILAVVVGQGTPVGPGSHDLTLPLPGFGDLNYALFIPDGYSPSRPVPLVLVLHPGGERIPNYGREFTELLVQPALGSLGAIVVAPDCPAEAPSWTDPAAEQAVVTLVRQTLEKYAIDRRRVLVTGYSMGGRGTWFLSARHPDLFTAAIPMAASVGNTPIDQLATMPTFIIHSRKDEVSPFAAAEQTAKQLTALGRTVRFEPVPALGHFEMFRYVDVLRQGGRWVAERWSKGR